MCLRVNGKPLSAVAPFIFLSCPGLKSRLLLYLAHTDRFPMLLHVVMSVQKMKPAGLSHQQVESDLLSADSYLTALYGILMDPALRVTRQIIKKKTRGHQSWKELQTRGASRHLGPEGKMQMHLLFRGRPIRLRGLPLAALRQPGSSGGSDPQRDNLGGLA